MARRGSVVTIGELCDQGVVRIQTGPFGSQLHAHDYRSVGTAVIPTEAIGRLLRNPDLRRRRGAAARARAARYTVEAMVAGTLALYQELLAQPSRRRINL